MEDNKGTVLEGSEGVRHAKHIFIHKNFVRDNARSGMIRIIYCSTRNMVADILRKPPARLAFSYTVMAGVLSPNT